MPVGLQGRLWGNRHSSRYMGDCQNYGPFLGPYYNTGPNTGPNLGDPKRDHNFDNLPYCPKLLSIRGPIFRFLLEYGAPYTFPPFWEQ